VVIWAGNDLTGAVEILYGGMKEETDERVDDDWIVKGPGTLNSYPIRQLYRGYSE
jgi:hypothetical protein